MLRLQLQNNYVGTLTEDGTADPIDSNQIKSTVKRSSDAGNDGVVFTITFNIDFIKKSRRFIKQAFEQGGGIDAEVIITWWDYNFNTRRWELFNTGEVDYSNYDIYGDTITVNMAQVGMQRRILNLMNTDVDIETLVSQNGNALPPQKVQQAALHSKKITSTYSTGPTDDSTHQDILDINEGFYLYTNIDNGTDVITDLQTTIQYPWQFVQISDTPNLPTNNPLLIKYKWPTEVYNAKLPGIFKADIQLSLNFAIKVIDLLFVGNGVFTFFAFYEHRDNNDNVITKTKIGQWIIVWDGTADEIESGVFYYELQVPETNYSAGDKAFVYAVGIPTTNFFAIQYVKVTPVLQGTNITFTQLTEFPESKNKVVLLHDAVQRVAQYYSNQVDCFKSTLLGRTDLGYPSDGPGAYIATTNGNALRGVNKPIFNNLTDQVEFVNAAFCAGIGFETGSDGIQRMVLEQKRHFYDKNTRILSLGKLPYRPKRSINTKFYYNQIEVGYNEKLDLPQTNGVDEFNTIRRFSIPIVNTSNQLKVSTKMLAGGFQIEFQRRLISSTDNGKMDDENFVIVMIKNNDGSYRSKKNEGYSSIINVIDPGSGYNYDISPARNLQNWMQFLASGTIRSFNKNIKASYGEGNYLLQTLKAGETLTIDEYGTYDISKYEPLWDNFNFTLENVPLSRDQFKLIKANPYGYIDFEDYNGDVLEGFISDVGIEYNSNIEQATLNLLQVYRP